MEQSGRLVNTKCEREQTVGTHWKYLGVGQDGRLRCVRTKAGCLVSDSGDVQKKERKKMRMRMIRAISGYSL